MKMKVRYLDWDGTSLGKTVVSRPLNVPRTGDLVHPGANDVFEVVSVLWTYSLDGDMNVIVTTKVTNYAPSDIEEVTI